MIDYLEDLGVAIKRGDNQESWIWLELSDKQLESFKNIYGVSEIDGDVYINRFNLILTSSIDYDNLKYVIKDLVIEFNIPEYGMCLYVFRKLNDPMLNEVFN